MRYDPFTLVVVLASDGAAAGSLYLDDGDSFEYREGAYLYRKFAFDSVTHALVSEDAGTRGKKTDQYLKKIAQVRVEKVIVVGAPASWKTVDEVTVTSEGAASATKAAMMFVEGGKGKADWAVLKDPGVLIGKAWKIQFP